MGIKASIHAGIPNMEVWKQAGEPTPPSKLLNLKQKEFLGFVFLAKPTDPVHSIVFYSAYKDRILTQDKRRGRQMPVLAKGCEFKTLLRSNLAGP